MDCDAEEKRRTALGQRDVRDETRREMHANEKVNDVVVIETMSSSNARRAGARPRSRARPALGLYERHRVSTYRTNVHELLGTNVIGADQEGGVVVVQQFGHALGVALLLDGRSGRHDQSFLRVLLSHGGTKYCF